VLAPPPPPAWDAGAVSGPVVRRFCSDDGDRWFMWYGGRPAAWAGAAEAPPADRDGWCGVAMSADGVVWERTAGPKEGGAILTPNADDWWWFDTRYVALGDVDIATNELVRSDGGVYFAYISGGAGEGVGVGDGRTAIGVALSKDGEHWTRVEGGFPSGAVLEAGAPGAWDAAGVAGPAMVRAPGGTGRRRYAGRDAYVMYYHAWDAAAGAWAVGRAVSEDGFAFARDADGGQPALVGGAMACGADAAGVRRCCVARAPAAAGGRWWLFAEVVDAAGVGRIAACESDDALRWGERRVVLDVDAAGGGWDAAGVTHPSVVVVDGAAWLYYSGRAPGGDGRTGIGLAVSRGADWSVFERRSGVAAAAAAPAPPAEEFKA
jgi:hypothetical protein